MNRWLAVCTVALAGVLAINGWGSDTAATPATTAAMPPTPDPRALLDYKFTNELGAPVCLNDFRGQVIAYTFIFTRCPAPNYCPRLSKNFEEAAKRLAAMPNAPANWHLISVSFDPDFDTPAVLRACARRYHYDPARWTFLTGPKAQIGELARFSGVNYRPEEGLFTHNFRTLVVDAEGRLRVSYPVGGDLSDALASEIVKAAGPQAPQP
jgi:protein SCO1/2